MYIQISVTSRLNPPYHSMYFGASIKSKSRIRFNAPMTSTTREKPMPTALGSWITGGRVPKRDATKSTR